MQKATHRAISMRGLRFQYEVGRYSREGRYLSILGAVNDNGATWYSR